MSNPWDRQRIDGQLEPMLWFERFTAFLLMGKPRSILECVNCVRDEKKQNRSNYIPGSWRRESEKWTWRDRADAWDVSEHTRLEAERQAEQERVRIEREAERELWARNRFEDMQKLRGKALELLTLPVLDTSTVEVDDDGNTIRVEIKGMSGRLAEVARVFKAADDLARITTGEPLPTIKQDIKTDGTVTIEYTGNVSPDEL